MFRRVHQKYFGLIFLLSLSLLNGQQKPELKSLQNRIWSTEIMEAPEHWLNRSIWVLQQTGQTPPYTVELLKKVDAQPLSNIAKSQYLLLASVPRSLGLGSTLPNSIKQSYEKLRQQNISTEQLQIIAKDLEPNISDIESLRKNTRFLKNALQLIALTTIEGNNLPEDISEPILQFTDRGIYFFTAWRESKQDERILGKFLESLAPYYKKLEAVLRNHQKGGSIPGDYAIIRAELNYLQTFFQFREDLWQKYMSF